MRTEFNRVDILNNLSGEAIIDVLKHFIEDCLLDEQGVLKVNPQKARKLSEIYYGKKFKEDTTEDSHLSAKVEKTEAKSSKYVIAKLEVLTELAILNK